MNLNLLDLEDNIFDYLQENFPGSPELTYVNDFLDLDKYKTANTCFVQFPSADFTGLTNESNEPTLDMEVFLVCRNGTSSDLKDRVLTYGDAFYNFFYEDQTLGGLVDIGSIMSQNLYLGVEGNPNLKIISYRIQLRFEV